MLFKVFTANYPLLLHIRFTSPPSPYFRSLSPCPSFAALLPLLRYIQGVSPEIVVAQNCVCFFLVVYLIVSSSNFVHRYHSCWRRNPFANLVWAFSICGLLLLHLIFCAIQMSLSSSTPRDVEATAVTTTTASATASATTTTTTTAPPGLSAVPAEVWLLLALWPATLIGILEALKHSEIKRFVRQQKLQRLNFDTKLGMNSPW